MDDFLIQQLKLYGILIGWSLLVVFFNGITVRFFEETYFVLSPLLMLFILQQVTEHEALQKKLNIIFYMLIAANLVYTGAQFFDFFKSASSFSEELLTSTSTTESPYAFDFGLFAIYYYLRKKKTHWLLALFFSVVAFKRIVLLGLIVGVLLFFFLRSNFQRWQRGKFVLVMATLINLILVINIYLFSRGDFDDLIQQILGVSANYLSQGRYILYQGIFEMINISTYFTGMGFGSITHYLVKSEAFLNNLHSDLLKVFIEFGVLFYVYWIYQFYRKTYNQLPLLVLSVFVNILFITDNVFVYFDVMFFYYLFIVLLKDDQVKTHPVSNINSTYGATI